MTSGGMKASGDIAVKLEKKERKGSSTTDLVYGLGEDLEEDKRE